MRTPIVAGNWKMNGSRAETENLVNRVKAGGAGLGGVEIIVCPPFVYIQQVAELLELTPEIAYGAQNLDPHDSGAYTGEIAAAMLLDFGCRYVIVGHSERRTYYGETSELVAEKAKVALHAGLTPIVCVGETLEQRESDQTEPVVGEQVDAVVNHCGITALNGMVLAYEPVWAIGTGKTATPDQAQAVHRFIRRRLHERDSAVADSIRILYGGSVKGANAAELFAQPDIDGGLIGGAALVADDFLAICQAAV